MTDIKNLITDNIDVWTSAIKKRNATGRGSSKKIELTGIKKLRELILELAVRGKLVPQDSSDEPASALLDKIAVEKAQLISDKVIKKAKGVDASDMPEVSFILPDGWSLSTLTKLIVNSAEHIVDGPFGSNLKATEYVDSGVPLIRIQNVDRNIFKNNGIQYLTEDKAKSLSRHSFVAGDIVLNKLGEPTGKACIIPAFLTHGIIVADLIRVRVNEELHNKQFLIYCINSPLVARQFSGLAKGVTRQRVNLSQVRSLKIPLPPLAEQQRIVAKVDELMALCDQLEQQTEQSLSAHQTLVEVLLEALTNCDSTEDFQASWQRIAEHFDVLFTTEHSIEQLKQTILQLAVIGKLVPQNPNDEPASVLLEKIAEEKAQLIADKKIKKHPKVVPIGPVMSLPDSWVDIVVQDFADIKLGSTPSRTESEYWNGDIHWVSSGEVANKTILDTKEKITQEGYDNSSTPIIPARSLLMAIIGQGKTRGQTALLGIDACTNQNVAAFVFNQNYVVPEFVQLWAQSKYDSHRGDGHGGAQPALNGKKVRSFRFGLAPLAEQHRIVAEVERLMALCEQLKVRLSDAQTTQLHLADAVVTNALN
ncbi:MAG TPA: restriction endonuclease [Colwellia sp.]|nr:restriction endonuclease [Colwellia sp.]